MSGQDNEVDPRTERELKQDDKLAEEACSPPTEGGLDVPADLDILKESGESESGESDIEELCAINKEHRPFRDQSSMLHENEHFSNEKRTRNSDSMCSTTSAASVDPRLVKLKIKRQLKKEGAKQHARRIRKAGEAALATQSRRDNMADIGSSKDWGWD